MEDKETFPNTVYKLFRKTLIAIFEESGCMPGNKETIYEPRTGGSHSGKKLGK